MINPNNYHALGTPKISEANRKSEDAYLPEFYKNETTWWTGIADGAGGEGFFAAEWANCLLENLKSIQQPFETDEEIDKWLETFYKDFTENQQKQISQDDIYAKQKFDNEGANATLAALWLKPQQHTMNWVQYGDSCIFFWDKNELQVFDSRYLKDLNQFSGHTHLINSQQNLDGIGFRKGEIDLENKSGTILLATDALSQLIIVAYKLATKENENNLVDLLSQAGNPLASTIKPLQTKINDGADPIDLLFKKIKTPDGFSNFCHELYKCGALLPDDYSLIRFDI